MINLDYTPDARLLAAVAAYGGAGPVAEQGQMQGAQLDQAYYSNLNTLADNARQQQAQQLSALQHADDSARGWQGLYQSGVNQAQQVAARGDAMRESATQREADRQARYDIAGLNHASQADLEEMRQGHRMDLAGYGAQNRSDLMEQKFGALDTMRLSELDRQEQAINDWADRNSVPRDSPMFAQARLAINSSRAGIQPRFFPRAGGTGGNQGAGSLPQQGGPPQQQQWVPGAPWPINQQEGDQTLAPREGMPAPQPGVQSDWVQGPAPGIARDPYGNLFHQVTDARGQQHWAVLHQARPEEQGIITPRLRASIESRAIGTVDRRIAAGQRPPIGLSTDAAIARWRAANPVPTPVQREQMIRQEAQDEERRLTDSHNRGQGGQSQGTPLFEPPLEGEDRHDGTLQELPGADPQALARRQVWQQTIIRAREEARQQIQVRFPTQIVPSGITGGQRTTALADNARQHRQLTEDLFFVTPLLYNYGSLDAIPPAQRAQAHAAVQRLVAANIRFNVGG